MKKRWEQDGENYALHFEPFYEDIILAVLYKDADGDWYFKCELVGAEDEYISNSEICLHDVKLEVEERITDHYEGEKDYYQTLLNNFIGEN